MSERETLIQIFNESEELLEATYDLYTAYEQVSYEIYEIEQKKGNFRHGLTTMQKVMMIVLFPLSYGIGTIIYYFYAKSKNQKHNEQLNSQFRKLENLKNKQQTFVNEILECHKCFNECGGLNLPMKYFHPTALKSFDNYFRTGRADSLKEAMNLFEAEQHRLNMENMQNEALRQAQIANNLAIQGNAINAANAAANIFR